MNVFDPSGDGDFLPYILVGVGIIVVLYVWVSLALSRVFAKAGEKPSLAWIPFVSLFTLVKISGRKESPWLILVPFYNIYLLVLVCVGVSQRFGRSSGFGVFGGFFLPIWASILGWGVARWIGAGTTNSTATPDYWSQAPQRPQLPEPDQRTRMHTKEYEMPKQPSWPEPASNSTGGWEPFAPLLHGDTSQPQAQQQGQWQPYAQPQQPAAAQQSAGQQSNAEGRFAAPQASNPAPNPAAAQSWSEPPANIPPRPPLPGISAAQAAKAEPAAAASGPVLGQPGSTRMREDSEVVAQARRAWKSMPPPPPIEDYGNEPASPIVVPGASGVLPGAVPAPAVPAPAVPPRESVPPSTDVDEFDDSSWAPSSNAPRAATPNADPARAGIPQFDAPVASQAHDSDSWSPRLRHGNGGGDLEPELDNSMQVSAVVGSPDAGAPRSALASVSAQHPEAGVPREEGIDHTHAGERKKPQWQLRLPVGSTVALTSDYVILGRRPQEEPEFESAQLISIADGTRTISKTHAVLALVNGAWTITDLGSTNGVALVDDGGNEHELTPHTPAPLTARFLLGDAELSIEPAAE